jgi:hypothetical protein
MAELESKPVRVTPKRLGPGNSALLVGILRSNNNRTYSRPARHSAAKGEKNLRRKRGSRKVGKRIGWFWEAYWNENGRDVSRRFSETTYGDGIAERKAREARLASEERSLNLRRSSAVSRSRLF